MRSNLPGRRAPLRVRHEPPTIAEAFAAARDLSDDPDGQIEIAAGLMGIPAEEARSHAASLTHRNERVDAIRSGPRLARRSVVVEHRRRVRAFSSRG